MADDPTPSDSPDLPPDLSAAQPVLDSRPRPSVNGAAPETPAPPRRRVYESTLIPERRRRRVSPYLVFPGLILILGCLLFWGQSRTKRVRVVNTAGKIVYASDAGSAGVPHLWIAGTDGSGARRLTQGAEPDMAPTFSRDGSRIAWLSTRAGTGGKRENQVFVMDADGQHATQATRYAGDKSQPAFAPSDSTLIGFTSGGKLFVADTQTGETTRLLPAQADEHRHGGASEAEPDVAPAASPTTVSAFAFAPSTDRTQQGLAAVMEAGGVQGLAILPTLTGTARMTQNGKPDGPPLVVADAVSLGWSPEGGLLAVALLGGRVSASAQISAIVLFDGQGSPVQSPPLALFGTPTIGPQNPVFSPDGATILFELWSQPSLAERRRMGLALVALDGSGPPRQLYRGAAEQAQWTRDGQTVLFLAARKGGGHDLFRVGMDGKGLRRVSDGRADVSAFALSPQSPAP